MNESWRSLCPYEPSSAASAGLSHSHAGRRWPHRAIHGSKSANDFKSDDLLQDGVVRNIEILGEASKSLLEAMPDAGTKFPGIPFAAIYAMRNQLSHGYFTIDLDIVWNVVQHEIPALRAQLTSAIEELERPST